MTPRSPSLILAALCALLSACGSPVDPSDSAGGPCAGPKDCGADEVCRFNDMQCGRSGGDGVCEPRPDRCNLNYSPEWACDGQLYGNDCAALAAGQDIDTAAPFTTGMGRSFCGVVLCDRSSQYCRKGPDEWPYQGQCLPLPSTCDAMTPPDCSCLAQGAPPVPGCSACELVAGLPTIQCGGD